MKSSYKRHNKINGCVLQHLATTYPELIIEAIERQPSTAGDIGGKEMKSINCKCKNKSHDCSLKM